MEKLLSITKHKHFIPMLTFIICFALHSVGFYFYLDYTQKQQRLRYNYIADSQINKIDSCLDKIILRTDLLKENIIEKAHEADGATNVFNHVAPMILANVRKDTSVTLRNIAIAPDFVVSEVFPRERNEKLVGFNFADQSLPGNKEAIEAFNRNQLIITNPFPLIQGGVGMAARTPVFLTTHHRKELWGLVTITMDFSDLLQAFNLEALSNMGLNYELWYTDARGKHVTLAATRVLPDAPITTPFNVKNLKWNLDIAPMIGWYNRGTIGIGFILILIASLIIARFSYTLLKLHRTSQRLNDLKERDLVTLAYTHHYLANTLLNPYTGNWVVKDPGYSMSVFKLEKEQIEKLWDTNPDIHDRLIFLIGDIISRYINERLGDLFIRWDTFTFIVLWKNIDPSDMEENVSNIEERIKKLKFNDLPNYAIKLKTASVPYFSAEESRFTNMFDAVMQLIEREGE